MSGPVAGPAVAFHLFGPTAGILASAVTCGSPRLAGGHDRRVFLRRIVFAEILRRRRNPETKKKDVVCLRSMRDRPRYSLLGALDRILKGDRGGTRRSLSPVRYWSRLPEGRRQTASSRTDHPKAMR